MLGNKLWGEKTECAKYLFKMAYLFGTQDIARRKSAVSVRLPACLSQRASQEQPPCRVMAFGVGIFAVPFTSTVKLRSEVSCATCCVIALEPERRESGR